MSVWSGARKCIPQFAAPSMFGNAQTVASIGRKLPFATRV